MEPDEPYIDAVTALIDDIARDLILPRFRRLRHEDVERKPTPEDPDDIVTAVDREVELRLTDALLALVPSSEVVGEEAAHRDPRTLQRLESDGPLWVVDPIDGTRHFARGDEGFGVMVAFVVRGEVRAGWILLPALGQCFVAQAGGGVFVNGARATAPVMARELRARLLARVGAQ